MPVIKGKFAQQLRDVVAQYERYNAGRPLPLTKFEHEFQRLVHHPLTRRPGQKLSALLDDVPGLQTCFADRARPKAMFVRTTSNQPHYHQHQQLVLSRHGKARDTRNPLLLVKLLVESRGSAGLPLASLEETFRRTYNQPSPRPSGMKLADFLDQHVRGVECYHPEPGKPHKFVRATGSSALTSYHHQQQQQQQQQCFVEEEIITEVLEETAGPDVLKPVTVDTILCVDTSISMEGRLMTEACAGVAGVCAALAERACGGDTLSLIGFGSAVHELQARQPVASVDATRMQAQLRGAVGGFTALRDAIARGVVSAKTRPGTAGQDDACFAEVMVLTDGNENNSNTSIADLRALLAAAGTKLHSADRRCLVHVTLVYVGSSRHGRAQLDELAQGLKHVTVKAYNDSQGGIAKAFSGFVTAMASRTVRRVRTTKKVRRMVATKDNLGGSAKAAAAGKKFRKPMQNMNRRR